MGVRLLDGHADAAAGAQQLGDNLVPAARIVAEAGNGHTDRGDNLAVLAHRNREAADKLVGLLLLPGVAVDLAWRS